MIRRAMQKWNEGIKKEKKKGKRVGMKRIVRGDGRRGEGMESKEERKGEKS